MKVFIAPSKARNHEIDSKYDLSEPVFKAESDYLFALINEFTIDKIAKVMKLSGKLLDQTFLEYKNYKTSVILPAILSYTGTVFKEIDIKKYNEKQTEYLNNSVLILSAMYGALKPFDGVRYYRLDMTMKVMDSSMYSYWKNKVNHSIVPDELVISLSSKEFSKMIAVPFITIEFKQKVSKDKYKTVAIYSKVARGKMLNYMIMNNICSLDAIKLYDLDGYSYNKEQSNDKTITFTR